MSKSLANRRRTAPWIQRWSRPLIGGVAILGILNTAYLTITKLTNGATACPSGGCEQVLSSAYATVFGLPLALFGLLAYIGMAVFALAPLAVPSDQQKELRSNLENWTWLLLFIGSTAMLVFSGYLMSIMFTKFVIPYGAQGICYYCVASAIFATTLFVLTLLGRAWDDIGQLFFTGIIVGMVTLVGTLALYAPVGKAVAGAYNITSGSGQVFFTVQDTSGDAEIQLARHLKKIGAKMYSAYWCPHCYEQKKIFGTEALKDLPFVECAPDGKDSQTAVCQETAVKVEKETGKPFGFPTWEINGKFYSGQETLQELATQSGYQGPQNFKNRF
ncbi:MAG: vitamin K epoxide reductase family protein [Stenomitos rutilans HA7619-LM2]|jgi:uncharacterized membrane protein|nr:vitamin K epoxide reductase family protein [Stenomitos rutilans HA7619-LM2]